jgi:hypothetical protein
MEANYYEILGSAEDASQEEIERIYKRLATRHHPDRGGDPEVMKSINEAYRVLGNEFTRRAYDARRRRAGKSVSTISPPLSVPSTLLPNTIFGRLLASLFILLGGLFFLFLVRIYYIRFMWPVFLFALSVVLFGIWKLHEVMIIARKNLPSSHVLARWTWAQEFAFWGVMMLGAYTIYILMIAM